MKLLVALFIVCVFAGCTPERVKKNNPETGKLRHQIFTECMELAAKMPRQADDDVSDIVKECGRQSYYMANHMTLGHE